MAVRVAVGVVLREEKVFIALRPKAKHKGGFWEFPGGKIEAGESAFDALRRELKEEIDIEVISAEPFTEIIWDYPEKTVQLEVMVVRDFQGEPKGKEGQETIWAPLTQLKNYSFPEANESIVDLLVRR